MAERRRGAGAVPAGRPDGPEAPERLRTRFRNFLTRRLFLRAHMTCIVASVMAAGVLTSKLLLLLGVRSLPLRWGLAVAGSYLVFFVLVRLWVLYVEGPRRWGTGGRGLDLGGLDVPSWGGGGGRAAVPFPGGGGGHFGGGGASAVFDSSGVDVTGGGVPSGGGVPVSGGGSSSSGWGLSLDLDDGLVVVIVLALLLAVLLVAGGYVVYAAPDVLSEVAFQAILAGPLSRRSRRLAAEGWVGGLFRSTVIPLLIVLVAAVAAGWTVHHVCPAAVSVKTAVHRCVLGS